MELKVQGVFLLLAGWLLMLAAILMLSSLPLQTSFSLAGLAVELLGFFLLTRSHIPQRKKHDA